MQSNHTETNTISYFHNSLSRLLILILLLAITGCTPISFAETPVNVVIKADGNSQSVQLPPGSTVNDAISEAKIEIDSLDEISPQEQTVLTEQLEIQIIRVSEEFEMEETIIPFQNQKVYNESLPEGQTLLIQPGENGIQQITYRIIFEDGIETTKTVFKKTMITEPQPEIVMVGVQTPFTAVSISGTIAYLTSGNAWVMEGTTGNRRPVITTGDLDGRIFSLSPDGNWLMYSRGADENEEELINSLWAVNINAKTPKAIDLRVNNVVHFADWIPGRGLSIAYSTVEPRSVAPGWQANNDLYILKINAQGVIVSQEEILESSAGGIYGWWGTDFEWSLDGSKLAYARPDSIGLVNLEKNKITPILDLIPLQTRSDWAWIPELSWSPDNSILYAVDHKPMSGLATVEISPLFDLTAILPTEDISIDLVSQTGMFAHPVSSPFQENSRYQVAYLQAIFPEQSESSRYRLIAMDHDGSNKEILFPSEGSPGLEPQKVVWGKDPVNKDLLWIAFNYQGNLWLLNTDDKQAKQITGDGSISRLDWVQ